MKDKHSERQVKREKKKKPSDLVKFNIAGKAFVIEVEGEIFEIRGVKCTCHIIEDAEFDTYTISHYLTGMRMSKGFTKEQAIEKAEQNLSRGDIDEIILQAKKTLQEHGYAYPLNSELL